MEWECDLESGMGIRPGTWTIKVEFPGWTEAAWSGIWIAELATCKLTSTDFHMTQ